MRLRAGVYLARDAWDRLDADDQHLVRAWAAAPALPPEAVFSHLTAALIHGWPVVGPLPDQVHVTVPTIDRTVHRAGVVLHAPGPWPIRASPTRLDGVLVSDALTTASAIARSQPVHVAAVAVDAAVRFGSMDVAALDAALPAGPHRGSRRSRLVLAALDARHESVGESFTAARLVQSGIGSVIPQHEFHHGTITDRVDFWLPELGVVVEFDGRQKYVDPTMLAGRDPGDVLWQEKRREDRIRRRREVRAVVRVTWWHLERLDRFQALLRSHDVHV